MRQRVRFQHNLALLIVIELIFSAGWIFGGGGWGQYPNAEFSELGAPN